MPLLAERNDISLSQLLVSALDCLEEGIVITDAHLDDPGPQIVFVNRGFENMTGYRAQEVVGRSPRLLQGPRTDREILARLKSDLQKQQAFRGELLNYRKDGSEFRVDLSIRPAVAADGRVSHFMAVQRPPDQANQLSAPLHRPVLSAQDVEHQTQRLNDQLAHMARVNTLGELAGRLAHELNQPLTAISNYAQGCANRLQSRQIDGDELVGVMDLIRDAALRAGGIVDRLRNFVRRKGPHQVEIKLETVIRKVFELIEPEIRQSRAQVDVEVSVAAPPISADESQIEQVFVSLIRNAIDAMAETPLDERRITIRAVCNSTDTIELSVCDQGCGLRGEAAERCFEPFFSTKPFGLGMGLPVSRSIIQGHGGRLWIDAATDHGACFRFTLPLRHGDASNGDG